MYVETTPDVETANADSKGSAMSPAQRLESRQKKKRCNRGKM